MATERVPLPGYVQYSEYLAVNLHRSQDGERGADGVRAAGALVPVRSGFEPDILGCFHCCRVAHGFEDHAGGIREDHDGPGLRQEVSGLVGDRHTRPDQVTMRVLEGRERLLWQWGCSLQALRINSRGGTAFPGPFDHVPYGMRGQLPSTQEFLPRGHNPSFLFRMWKRRERLLRCHLASSTPHTRISFP